MKVFVVMFVLVFSVTVWAGDKEELMLEKKARIEAQVQAAQGAIQASQSRIQVLSIEYRDLAASWKAAGCTIGKDNQWTCDKAKKPEPKK